MNPIVEEIVNLIVNRVSEQVLLKVNESLDERIKQLIPSLIPAGADGKFSELQQQVIKDIAIAASNDAIGEAIDGLDIDSRVTSAIDDDLDYKVRDIVRDMTFDIDVR